MTLTADDNDRMKGLYETWSATSSTFLLLLLNDDESKRRPGQRKRCEIRGGQRKCLFLWSLLLGK